MRPGLLLLVAAAVLLAATGTVLAADNTAPLANAGVDQTVLVNSTVYLDANASTDPDGEVTSVEWAIETPDGTTVTPDCVDCRRTEFDATALGQYTVTLTVTDDDGATSSDTLYVTTTAERGPDVSISGPTSTVPDSPATFTANVSADDASLQTLTWLVNGSVVERRSLDGYSSSVDFTHSFDSTVPVRAVVYDTLGERGSATHRISVASRVGGGGGVTDDADCFDGNCGDLADKRYSYDGESYIVDDDNDGQVTTYIDGDLTKIDTDAPSVTETNSGTYSIEGGAESVSDTHTTDMTINDEGKAVEEPENPDTTENTDSGNTDGGNSDSGNSDSGNSDGSSDFQEAADEAEDHTGGMVSRNDDGSVSAGLVTIDPPSDGGDSNSDSSSSSGFGGFSGGGIGALL